jgi:hypothetical protein
MPRKASIVVAVVALVAALAAACTDEADSESSASQESVEQISARVQRNEMITALLAIGALPLHDMDVAIADGTVESNFIPDTREALRLLALTDWAPALAADADALRRQAADLLAALRDDDVAAAAEPAAALHEGWHQFEGEAWNVVAADLPADEGGPEEDDHGDEEPADGMTPAADSEAPADAGDDAMEEDEGH